MSSKYHIVRLTYQSGDIRYQIQQKLLFWWFDVGGEYWEKLVFAQERLRLLKGNRVVSEEVV